VGEKPLIQFCEAALLSSGAQPRHANAVARVLVEADMRAVYSHGINRLKMYVDECATGSVSTQAEPKVEKDRGATAVVDGQNVLGAVVGEFAMELAIQKAREHGIGWVLARNSNHYGIAGHYAMMALEHQFIGMSWTNTSPIVVPTRARNPALGTNPIALAAPTENCDPFVLDMATSAVALGKVEVSRRKREKLPFGWCVGRTGLPTDDAKVAINSSSTGEGGLMPLGGDEKSSGYKGYGLAMLVEVLGGVLGNANFGRKIRTWQSPLLNKSKNKSEKSSSSAPQEEEDEEGANLGQAFVVIDPDVFGSGFPQRMDEFIGQMHSLPSGEGQPDVLVPGDLELNARKEQAQHGIRLHESLIDSLNQMAEDCGIPKIKTM
jgi:LDH2 family malate/lactate/ureidoglycolate dehydrogenase